MARKKKTARYLNLSFGDTGPKAIHGFIWSSPGSEHRTDRDYVVWFVQGGGFRLGRAFQGQRDPSGRGYDPKRGMDREHTEILRKLLVAALKWSPEQYLESLKGEGPRELGRLFR